MLRKNRASTPTSTALVRAAETGAPCVCKLGDQLVGQPPRITQLPLLKSALFLHRQFPPQSPKRLIISLIFTKYIYKVYIQSIHTKYIYIYIRYIYIYIYMLLFHLTGPNNRLTHVLTAVMVSPFPLCCCGGVAVHYVFLSFKEEKACGLAQKLWRRSRKPLLL